MPRFQPEEILRALENHAGNVYGGAVNVAARVSAEAGPGEVIASDLVRSLARTSSPVSFEDRGQRDLKGVAEPLRLYLVLQPADD